MGLLVLFLFYFKLLKIYCKIKLKYKKILRHFVNQTPPFSSKHYHYKKTVCLVDFTKIIDL